MFSLLKAFTDTKDEFPIKMLNKRGLSYSSTYFLPKEYISYMTLWNIVNTGITGSTYNGGPESINLVMIGGGEGDAREEAREEGEAREEALSLRSFLFIKFYRKKNYNFSNPKTLL